MFAEIVDTLAQVQDRLKRFSQELPAGYWQGEALAAAEKLSPLLDGSVACCQHALHSPEIEGIRSLAASLPSVKSAEPRGYPEPPLTDDDVEYDANG